MLSVCPFVGPYLAHWTDAMRSAAASVSALKVVVSLILVRVGQIQNVRGAEIELHRHDS
jgi:hypothetical protein